MLNRKLKIIAFVFCIVILLSALVFAEDFKVKLGLYERLVTMSLLPATGNYATLKIITELNLMLAPTDEEYKAAGLEPQENGGVIAKNWQAVPEKEFTFKETALKLIQDALKKLDEEGKLTMEHYRCYEKFMIVKKEE
jgi:hypothetical protein